MRNGSKLTVSREVPGLTFWCASGIRQKETHFYEGIFLYFINIPLPHVSQDEIPQGENAQSFEWRQSIRKVSFRNVMCGSQAAGAQIDDEFWSHVANPRESRAGGGGGGGGVSLKFQHPSVVTWIINTGCSRSSAPPILLLPCRHSYILWSACYTCPDDKAELGWSFSWAELAILWKLVR